MGEDVRFERRMSDADALMWRVEKDPMLRSTIVSVSVFDQAPDHERVRAKIETGTRLIPRLRQRVVPSPLSQTPPLWLIDPHFDLDYHLRFVGAPGDGSLRALLDYVAPLGMQSFDRVRPLWEFTVVEGLADGRSALIQKIHHSLTDGVGGVRLAMLLLDIERHPAEPSRPLPSAAEPEAMSFLERLVDAAQHERRRQLGIARRSVTNMGRLVADPGATTRQASANLGSTARLLAPAFAPLSPILGGRSLSLRYDYLVVPTDELKVAARLVDAKLNDAFVAAVAGGLRRYHERHGVEVDALRMTMPINVRVAETEDLAGNQISPARFLVPVGIVDPKERMQAVRAIVAEQRAEPSLGFTEGIAGVINRLGTTVATGLFGRMLKGVDFLTSNVPGAPIPVYFGGAQLETQLVFGPLSGSAMNLTLLSYLDECMIGVNTDPASVPDPDVLLACLEEGFDEVRKLA